MTDNEALIEEARTPVYRSTSDEVWQIGGVAPVERDELIGRLTDAVEALLAERGALKAQLDGMTEEWGIERDEASAMSSRAAAEREIQRQRARKGAYAIRNQRLVKRFVTPWVEVGADL